MPNSRRITQADIARATGVSTAAVSLALQNDPRIKQATRDKILEEAKRLGYVPDPLLSALSRYRRPTDSVPFQGTIAWLAQTAPPRPWRSQPVFQRYLEAVRLHSGRHGYAVEVMDLQEMGVSWARAGEVALARGINGIILCPENYDNRGAEAFPWDRFSCITFGDNRLWPYLHRVAPAHFRGMQQLMQELHARGYRHPGLIVTHDFDFRVEHSFTAGYTAGMNTYFDGQTIPFFDASWVDSHPEKLREWIERWKPDVVVSTYGYPEYALEALGYRVPDDIGVACPVCVDDVPGRLSGMALDISGIAQEMILLLDQMIKRSEQGLPEKGYSVLVDNRWHESSSLRPPSPSGSTPPSPRDRAVASFHSRFGDLQPRTAK